MLNIFRSAAVLTQDTQDRRQIVSRDKNGPGPKLFTSKVEFVRSASKLSNAGGGMGVLTLMLFLTIIGCTSDAQNIRATNEAAATPPATSTPLSAEIGPTEIRATNEPATAPPATSTPVSAEIDSTDIRDGDCITSKLPEGIDIESVVIVPCAANWRYRALNSFTVEDSERYPGESLFGRRAYKECDRRYTNTLFPTADSWALGDRIVICLQESFGLSGTERSKLDRLVSVSNLALEECLDEAPETEHVSVELVSCTGDWQYRTLNIFVVDDVSRYPGDVSFSRRAQDECNRRYTTIRFPTADSWALGDRSVICLQESFGLSVTEPSKLDRLVNRNSLNAEKCFNAAPETKHVLVELVGCSGDWQFRTLNFFAVDDVDRYPTEISFRQKGYTECDRRYSIIMFPDSEAWELGDRRVTCLQIGFGQSGTDTSTLDRLVISSRLDVEECFNEAPETDYALVELVSCSGEWQYRTLSSFAVDDADRYPGEGHFRRRAFSKCDQRYTTSLFPTEDSWALGDRSVICLQEGFGLSGNDPSKLDRLVDSSRLNVEECFNEAPDTEYAMVELVDCSGEWEFQVVDRFLIPFDDAFPGDEYLEGIAGQECDDSFDFYFSPTAESWDLGDRAITCVKSSQ